MTSLLPIVISAYTKRHEGKIVGNKKKLTMINWLVWVLNYISLSAFLTRTAVFLCHTAGEVSSEEIFDEK